MAQHRYEIDPAGVMTMCSVKERFRSIEAIKLGRDSGHAI